MSVIRRRHTCNFATISNALRDDERLKADEVGILYVLLTFPPDWEIRRPQLRKRWGLGQKGLKRVIDSWMRTGWCRVEKVRLESGRFYFNYEIWPEPGPGMTDEEIRLVLSMESIEPDTDEEASSSESQEDITTETTMPSATTGPPPTGDGGVVHIESTKTILLNTDSTKALPLWRDFRASWPPGDILSPLACEKLFAALSPADRQRAFEAIRPYLANCRAKNRKLCDLSTYLKERRFAGNLAIPVQEVAIYGNTPQAFRWLEYRLALGERVSFMESCWRQGKPWHARTEWPPPLPDSANTPQLQLKQG